MPDSIKTHEAAELVTCGCAKLDLGDYDGALTDFSRALALCPMYYEAYARRGSAKYMLGDTEDAIDDWKKSGDLANLMGMVKLKGDD